MKMNAAAIERIYKEHNEKRVREQYFLGSYCRVLDKNGEIFSSSVGYADLARTRGIDDKTIFRLASMTKPISAVAFLQMVEKGRIGLDTPICEILPKFKDMKVVAAIENGEITATKEPRALITPRHLLSHTSGVGCGTPYTIQSSTIKKLPSLAESVDGYAEAALDFHPGMNIKYSPIWAFDIVIRLVEILADMPYEDYIKKKILDPLGMVDTTYAPNDEQIARTVDFVTRTENGLVPFDIAPRAGFRDFPECAVGGGAGLFSTPSDYTSFAKMLLHGGSLGGVKILEPSSMQLLTDNRPIVNPVGTEVYNPFALSVRLRGEPEGDAQPLPKGCYGWSGAFGCHFWVDVQNGLTCLYFMNLSNGGGSEEPASMEFERDVMSGIEM